MRVLTDSHMQLSLRYPLSTNMEPLHAEERSSNPQALVTLHHRYRDAAQEWETWLMVSVRSGCCDWFSVSCPGDAAAAVSWAAAAKARVLVEAGGPKTSNALDISKSMDAITAMGGRG
jgi:hypothetical protein